jgi:hypothetical protein
MKYHVLVLLLLAAAMTGLLLREFILFFRWFRKLKKEQALRRSFGANTSMVEADNAELTMNSEERPGVGSGSVRPPQFEKATIPAETP